MLKLRPYQKEIFRAVADSVARRKGLTFSVEMARQGGKNELSAWLEASLLLLNIDEPKNLVKCSPTFVPQAMISMERLKSRLDSAHCASEWSTERGYILKVGRARQIFLSAEESSRVVGHTAHILLEVDESQDVSKDKYTKEFRPMAATTNATRVLYGTAWDDSTLLEETKQTNLELERKDGIKRHFSTDWQEVAKYNPEYLRSVEDERQRLGEDHPLFRTQYRLLPVRAGGGFLSSPQRAQMQGAHPRLHSPQPGRVYVAGIDLAGEAEELEGQALKSIKPCLDSTVVTIAELDLSSSPTDSVGARHVVPELDPSLPGASSVGTRHAVSSSSSLASLGPHLRVVKHYSWTGAHHVDLYPQLVDLLKNVWHCRRVVVDATGVGQPVSAFLKEALGSVVVPFNFTAHSKSLLGFNLLAAVNSGRLKLYAGDGSSECQTFWSEMEKARSFYRPSQTLSFYVDPSDGHDDFLMSLALAVEAADLYQPRTAGGGDALPRCHSSVSFQRRLESRACVCRGDNCLTPRT